MRVLMLSSLWPPRVLGGAEQHAAAVAARLRAAGHEVGVVTYGVPGDDVLATVPAWPYALDEFAHQPAAKRALMHATDVWNPRTRGVLDRVLREFAPDVVHSHTVQGMSAVALTRPAHAGVAHVHTLHDYWLLCQRNSMVQRDGTACETPCRGCAAISTIRSRQLRADGPELLLAVSQAVAREHVARGWPEARVRVLPNPVEHRPASPRITDRAAITFGYLGQVAAHKGVRTLLGAFADAALPGARLLVAGSGPLVEEVAAAGGAVEAVGWIDADAKDGWLESLDCLVVPSEWKDPAPLVLNEARARGIPVIGAAIGGIPELLAPECAPLVFPAGDRAALATALRRFAAEPARYRPQPEAAPLDWDGHLRGLLDAYETARAIRADGGRG